MSTIAALDNLQNKGLTVLLGDQMVAPALSLAQAYLGGGDG
jgi:hypothetical protein